MVKNKKPRAERVFNLKESNHLLAEVLYADGVDIYKLSAETMKDLRPTIKNTRKRIDTLLKEHYETSFTELNNLPPEKLQKIRESFLGYYRGSVEKAEKLKKWIPLNQLVGYTEVLVASAYLQLNTEIDKDIEKLVSKDFVGATIFTEHLRMKILNAYKKINQGKKWEEVRQEVNGYLSGAGIQNTNELFEKWRPIFELINHPLQALYTEHVETMQINGAISDLQFAEQKRSQIIQNLVGSVRRSWKPADLEHDIQAQSAEANRSIIELTCNAIDANEGESRHVDVAISETGYSVRDYGSGMNPYVILEKLMIPKVSGKTGKETIGRFGVGFYTVLSHLKRKNDFVRVETRDGQIGYVIEFKIHERTGDIFVHTERNDELQKGTNVVVHTEDFDSQDAEKLCRELLAYNDHADIVLNGKKMNATEGFENLKGEQTSIKYLTEIADKAKVSIMVNGVVIEQINVSGVNLCQEVALDFPLTCSLPESRSELSVDLVAVASAKEIIETVLKSQIDESQKIAICNAIYPVLEKLQARSRSNKRADSLTVFFQTTYKNRYEMKGGVFLPNIQAFQVLNIPNAVYLDSRICSTDLEKIPGITKCEQFESNEGYQLYIADFKEGKDEFVVEDEKRLVIDRKVYERHKDTPAALNVYFSNLGSTGQSNREKAKGRISSGKKEVKKSETVEQQVEQQVEHETGVQQLKQIIFDTLVKNNIYKNDHPIDENELEQFGILPTIEQERQIREKILEEIEKFLKSDSLDIDSNWFIFSNNNRNQVSTEVRNRILFEIINVVKNHNLDDWDDLISRIAIKHDESISFFIPRFDLIEFVRVSKMIEKYPVIVKEAYDWFISGSECSSVYYLLDFLYRLDYCYSLSLLEKEFTEYSKEVIFNFFTFFKNLILKNLHLLTEEEYGTLQKAIFGRIKEIFFLKISTLILPEQKAIIGKLIGSRNAFCPLTLALLGRYQNIPRSVRGIVMYIVEGGEILNEKGFDEANIEQPEYQAQIPLSILVQAKKDNEQFFQGFSGTPAELVAHARESQKGVDPSKAMRDIMHSTENQIVNDGYLWIREVLQNSLDAVKQEKRYDKIHTTEAKNDKLIPEKMSFWKLIKSKFFRKHINSISNPETVTHPLSVKAEYGNCRVALDTYLRRKNDAEPDLVIEARDPVGMDMHTVINYLLIPNESSKKFDEETVGKFGQGFFTIFGDAKEVLIKTSKGNMRTEYIKIKPIKDQTGKIVDFSVEMSWKAEDFKGTVIQKVVDTDMPQVEAAFCKSAVVSYGGLIDRKAVQLDFREQEVNTPRTVLAETTVPKLGTMKMYDAHENAMTQNGLFIKELDEELLRLIPENLRKIMQKNGIVLDIPASIKLIKSRADIARKKETLPQLAEHIPALALRAYLSSVMLGKAELPNIPYDYFKVRIHRRVSVDIQSDAETIAQGNSLANYDRYLQDENALTQLLTMLPCVNIEGKQISIYELAEKISQDPDSVDIEKLPPSIQEKIRHATSQKKQEDLDQKKAKKEYGANDTMIMSDKNLPNDQELQKKASVYYAYDQLVRFIFQHSGALDVTPKYYLQVGQSKAHAYQGTNSIGFNLDYLEKQLPQLAEIIEQKLTATDIKVQRFLEEAIRLCTHERQHNLEGSEETQWTHNDTFFEGQRRVITRFIQDQGVNIQKLLNDIYKTYSASYMPAKEFAEQIKNKALEYQN